MGGAGGANSFARLTNDARALGNEVRNLVGQFNRLGRALTGSTTSGSFSQRQLAELRQVIALQQQVISNNGRMVAGPPGAGRGGPPGAPGSPWGRSGFSPNASLIDRMQYYGVNLGQRSLVDGALSLDRVRTGLAMLATPRPDPANPGQTLPGVISPEIVAQAEAAAAEMSQVFRVLNRKPSGPRMCLLNHSKMFSLSSTGRRSGIDPMNASAAQIAATLSPIFSNTSARSIAKRDRQPAR